MPLGVAGGVPYVALMMLGLRSSWHKHSYHLAILATILTIVGYFLSPEAGTPWVVLTNRAVAIFAIWVISVAVFKHGVKVSELDNIRRHAQTKEALRESEQKLVKQSALLTTALEIMAQGICVYDADQKLVAFNQEYIEMGGFPPDFIHLGMDRRKVVRFLAEQGNYGKGDIDKLVKERIASFIAKEEQHIERQRPNNKQCLFSRKVMPDGGFVGTYTDITDLKRAEEALTEKSEILESSLKTMGHGVCVYNADGIVEAFNDEFLRLSGLPSDYDPLGKSHEQILRKRAENGAWGDGDIEAIIQHRLSADKSSSEHENEASRPNGIVFNYHRKPMPGGSFVATYTDITERKRMEETMRCSMEQAELANRTKSEFLATMSHELRTPLNAIIGFSEMISSGIYGPIGDSKYVEYLKDINYSGKHLLDLINDILDISRVEAGQVELYEEEVDIVSVIDTVGRLLSEKAKEGSVSIETEIEGNPPLLLADERRVKQILLNLMTNAVKFTPEGGEITIKAGVNDDGAVTFSVIDTGIGIAPADIPKVLKPFRQADNTLSRKHEGTGLGLPLAKSFVELHGGSLDLKSRLGTGTTVTVTFPANRSLHIALGRQPQLH